MTTPDLARLCERLRAERLVDNSFGGGKFIRTNPDGPEAAAAIESLVAENERMREALTAMRDEIEHQRDLITHPNGRRAYFIDSTDQIRVDLLTDLLARTALQGASDDR